MGQWVKKQYVYLPSPYSVDEIRQAAERYGLIKDIYIPRDYRTSRLAVVIGAGLSPWPYIYGV